MMRLIRRRHVAHLMIMVTVPFVVWVG